MQHSLPPHRTVASPLLRGGSLWRFVWVLAGVLWLGLNGRFEACVEAADPQPVYNAAYRNQTEPAEPRRRQPLFRLSSPDEMLGMPAGGRIRPASFDQWPIDLPEPEPIGPEPRESLFDSLDACTPGAPNNPADLDLFSNVSQTQDTDPGIRIPPWRQDGAPGIRIPFPENGDEGINPTVNVTGQVQVDTLTFNQSDRNKLAIGQMENATGFRRARLGAFGEIFETTEYRIEWDFASTGRPRFLDNWIAIKGFGLPHFGNMIVGHFFEPFSIERYTPNRFITFLERSAVDDFAPARNTGLMLFDHTEDERATWAVGVFRSDSDQFGDSVEDRSDWAVTSHLTWLAWYDEPSDGRYLLHLGASHSFRAAGDRIVRFHKRPENQLEAFRERGFPSFVDTGPIPAFSHQLFGAEAAWVHGPFSMQAEYVYSPVRTMEGPNVSFHGWYVYGSYFLTGEHRSYSPTSILGRFREGIFQRITPRTNAFKGDVAAGNPRGPGAWEIAARWSHIDLNSRQIRGGELSTLTIGVNWYLNPNTRIQWNWVHPILREDGFGRSYADIVGMRFGFEF